MTTLYCRICGSRETWETDKQEALNLLQQALALLDRIDARTKESTK